MFRDRRLRFALAVGVLAAGCFFPPRSGPAQPPESGAYWRIGVTDGLSDEFAAGAAQNLDYRIGTSATTQWHAIQEASGTHPPVYRIAFPLSVLPAFPPVLAIEMYFLTEPPEGIELNLNGRRGYCRVQPAYAEDVDSRQAQEAAYTRQSIRIPLPLEALHTGENTIALSLAGGEGSVHYDSIALLKSQTPVPDISASLDPTVFFKNTSAGLREIAEITVRHQKPLAQTSATIEIAGTRVSAAAAASPYDFGEQPISIDVPALPGPAAYTLDIVTGGQKLHSSGEFRPERHWQIFATLRIHNDIGFTDLQPNVQELDARNADRVIDIASRFPSFKFNFEDAWLVDNYIHSRTPARTRRLLSLAAHDRVSVNPIYLNLLTGLCTAEELYRSLYFAGRLEAEGVPIKSACLTDVPTPSWFIPSLLRDAGVSYFASGGNQSRSLLLAHSRLNENSPFYWEGADGRRVLAWFARNYRQFNRLAGDHPTVARLRRTVPQFLARYRRPDYPVDAVMLYGLYGDNTDIRTGDAAYFDEWNRTFAFPKIVPATDADYFDYISARYAGRLPAYRGDAGSAWEDGAASTAAETATNRDTQRVLPAAEGAAGLATSLTPDERYPASEFRDAWKNVLFSDEHSWGAAESRTEPGRERVRRQWEIKRGYVIRAHDAARDLLTRSLNRLVQNISVAGPTLFIFNFGTAARTEPVEIELAADQQPIDLATNRPVALDVLDSPQGYRRVCFLAENVPAFGYRAYAIRRAAAPANPAEPSDKSWQIESRYYRVTFDTATGAIAQIHDKSIDRDLADPAAPYRLNELLYVAGGENTGVIRDFAPRAAQLDIHRQSAAELISKSHTPIGERIRIRARSGPVATVETEVSVYNGLKRIDIRNRVHKDEVQTREAVYFAFPFQVPHPAVSYEIQNVWVRPDADQLPGAPREWFATQNGVEAHTSGLAVAWTTPDAPLITLTDIDRGRWKPTLDLTNAHIYSWIMNNYWSVNYKASQGGDYLFRYFLTSDRELPALALSAFSASTRSALIPYDYYDTGRVTVTAAQKRLPAAQGSFFALNGCNAELSALKQAEDGAGLILRLHNPTADEAPCRLESPVFHIQSARLTDGVENNPRPLAVAANTVTFRVKPFAFTTVRLVVR